MSDSRKEDLTNLGYVGLLNGKQSTSAIRAALELCQQGWTTLPGTNPLETSYTLLDPTGRWAVKATSFDNVGYTAYVRLCMKSYIDEEGHLPLYGTHVQCAAGGSLTLMERLQPLGKKPSLLFERQKVLIETATIQHQHNTFEARLPQGTESLLANLGSETFIELVQVLALCMLVSRTHVAEWKRSDIMRRENGVEVLIDPFEPIQNLHIGKPNIVRVA